MPIPHHLMQQNSFSNFGHSVPKPYLPRRKNLTGWSTLRWNISRAAFSISSSLSNGFSSKSLSVSGSTFSLWHSLNQTLTWCFSVHICAKWYFAACKWFLSGRAENQSWTRNFPLPILHLLGSNALAPNDWNPPCSIPRHTSQKYCQREPALV